MLPVIRHPFMFILPVVLRHRRCSKFSDDSLLQYPTVSGALPFSRLYLTCSLQVREGSCDAGCNDDSYEPLGMRSVRLWTTHRYTVLAVYVMASTNKLIDWVSACTKDCCDMPPLTAVTRPPSTVFHDIADACTLCAGSDQQ